MNSSFDKAVEFVLNIETGQLTDNPNDPGGLTRWGIALRRHPELTADDIRNMTRERAIEIYRRDYWETIRGDELPEPQALVAFDACVNQGAHAAVTCLQRALGVTPDGILGPQTISVARLVAATPLCRVDDITSERIIEYSSLPQWKENGRGWTHRAIRAALEALR